MPAGAHKPTLPSIGPGLNTTALIAAITLLMAVTIVIYPEPVTPLAIAALPVAALLCYYFPVQIVIAAAALSLFRLHEAYPVLAPLKLPLAFGTMATGAIVLHLAILRTTRPHWDRALTYFAILIFFVILSAIFALNPSLSYDFITKLYWKMIIVTLGLAWLLRKPEHFQFAASMFVLGGVAVSLVAIYNWMNGIALVEGGRVTIGRPDSRDTLDDWNDPTDILATLGDPNDLALYLIIPLSFAVAQFVYNRGRLDRLFAAAAAITIILAIIFTQSRGGLLGVGLLLAVVIVMASKSRAFLLGATVAGALILTSAVALTGRVSGVAESAIERGLDESAQGRISSWGTAISMAVRRPFVGVGINNFVDSYHLFSENPRRRDKAVHSIWFQVIGELGFAAFAVFLALIVTLGKMAVSNHRIVTAVPSMPRSLRLTSLATAAALTGFLVSGSFLTQAFYWPIYIIFGLIMATSYTIRANAPADIEDRLRLARASSHAAPVLSHYAYSAPKSVNPATKIHRAIKPLPATAARRQIAKLRLGASGNRHPNPPTASKLPTRDT